MGVPHIPLPPDIDRSKLDPGDFFVTLPLMRVGSVSRKYGKRYEEQAVRDLVDAINRDRFEGLWGHPARKTTDMSDKSADYEPGTVRWVAALLDESGMAWGKLMPLDEKSRNHMRQAAKLNAKVSTSWSGTAYTLGDKVVEMKPRRVDLADPHLAGIQDAAAVPVISEEMGDIDPNEKQTVEFAESMASGIPFIEEVEEKSNVPTIEELQEQISGHQVEIAELKVQTKLIEEMRGVLEVEPNANLVEEMRGVVSERDQLRDENVTLKREILEEQISEAVDEMVPVKKLRPTVKKLLKMDEMGTLEEAKSAITALLEDEDIKDLAQSLVQEQAGPNALRYIQRQEQGREDAPEKKQADVNEWGL